MPKLFVIAGHGAGDPGAVGGGHNEAERVRALATKMKELAPNDVTLGDFNRNYYADGGVSTLVLPKDMCVIELHMDSGAASARGGHVIIKDGMAPDQYDKQLASNISAMFPGRSQTIVGRNNLANINRAANRGLNYRLLEVCFISNTNDLNKFNQELESVARTILDAFGIGDDDMTPEQCRQVVFDTLLTDPRNGSKAKAGDFIRFAAANADTALTKVKDMEGKLDKIMTALNIK